MKAKIDLEKFISSMLGYAEDNCEETMLDYLHSALQDQGLEYKDGEIVGIEQGDLRKRYERIGKSDWFKKNHVGISIGEQPSEEDVVGMGELGKVWNEQAIISRLDRIIELLERPIIMPFSQPIQPLQPIYYDTNKVYCDTANTEGCEE